jgi:formylglycine-generating enzyme required for sulfatase activity
MYTFVQAEDWCEARGKRLCFDDEWTAACAGAAGTAYPYGATRQPGVCNDEEIWRVYDQSLLNQWPPAASSTAVDSLDQLWAAAGAAADHVQDLYQGEAGGANAGCTNESGVFDLVGNVEEWTRRRDGGMTDFHGSLKGRYWAESRTCQSAVISHGDGFRFYEIGFRCCRMANPEQPR